MRTYCFDMDGVICKIDHESYSLRTPIKDTIQLMRKIKERGDFLIIHTGRHIDKIVETLGWLEENKVAYDHIQFGKPVADVYIDDRALRIEGKWEEKDLKYLQ